MWPEDEVRLAATVVLARPGPGGIEVLVVRRGPSVPFGAGFLVFPGGVVDPGDADLAADWWGDPGAAVRACAVRELYEEAGLLVAEAGLSLHPAPRPPFDPRSFDPPSSSALVEIARWRAPADVPVRFDAVFFAAAAPPGVDPSPDGVEAAEAWWARPGDVLDQQSRGDAPLMWPTLATLRALAECRTVDDVLRLRVPQAPRPASVPPPPPPDHSSVMRVLRGTTHIVRVLAPNPGPFTLEGTNTWVVGREPSVVVDPGPDHRDHLSTVLEVAAPLGAVLLTHRHPDHAEGAARLAASAGAPLRAYRPEAGVIPLHHREVVEGGSVRLRALHTPGHTHDHLVFRLEPEGAMFTGDTVLGRGTSLIDPPEGDMAAYVRSLHELRALAPRMIYPGHGPVVLDGVAKLDEYLGHRAERERQVLDALEEGKQTAEEMVPAIYAGETPESMYEVAARSVLAHLLKLEREGRVSRQGRHADARFVLADPRDCRRCGRPAAPGSSLCRQCAVTLLQERPER